LFYFYCVRSNEKNPAKVLSPKKLKNITAKKSIKHQPEEREIAGTN